MRFAPRFIFLLAAAALSFSGLLGCGDKAAVQLGISLQNPVLIVTPGTFGSSLGVGSSIDLSVQLGSEASGTRTIAPGSFVAHGTPDNVVLDPLTFDAGGTTFPFTLSPGDSKSIHFTLGFAQPLSQVEHDAFCPGPATILVSLLEDGKANSLASGALNPTCN